MTDTLARREDITPSMLPQYSLPEKAEAVLIQGDLAKLTSEERVQYYRELCRSLGLNPLSQPFEYITFQGKLKLYAKKDCTDQLRSLRGVSVEIVSKERDGDMLVAIARATLPDGRSDEDMGATYLKDTGGDSLPNAWMRAVTKAKRRVTLSICGLGWADESEVDAIPGSARVTVDHATGRILDPRRPAVPQPRPALAPPTVDAATGEVLDGPQRARSPKRHIAEEKMAVLILRCYELDLQHKYPALDRFGSYDLAAVSDTSLKTDLDDLRAHIARAEKEMAEQTAEVPVTPEDAVDPFADSE